MQRRQFLKDLGLGATFVTGGRILEACTAGAVESRSYGRTGADPLAGGESEGDSIRAPGDELGSADEASPPDDGPEQGDAPPSPGDEGGGDPGRTYPTLTTGDGITVGGSHSHDVTIPATDIAEATSSMGYTLSSGHTHTITLTASDFAALRACGEVVVTSTDGSGLGGPHHHSVTVRACS